MALNGRFPDSLLAYLGWPEADHLRLVQAAAASITRLAAAFEAAFGRSLYLSDAYRTYAQQVVLKVTKGVFAATPGTSNHGLGLAIDAASRINVDGSAEHRWMEANGPAYGWVNPAWAQDYNSNNGQHEPWHWEYKPALDTHPTPAPAAQPVTPTPAGSSPTVSLEVIDMRQAIIDLFLHYTGLAPSEGQVQEFTAFWMLHGSAVTAQQIRDSAAGQVAQAFRDELGRQPESPDVVSAYLAQFGGDVAAIRAALAASPEGLAHR